MHVLVVVSHPDPGSLTHQVAAAVVQGGGSGDGPTRFEIADLAAEGFDPRFTAHDLAVHRREVPFTADVVAEQARIDRADALVLVYPVYWWSFPALMKGWIDRVFVNGWAYDEAPGAGLVKKLGRIDIHLVALGGADLRTYARHGYFGAMRTQIDHGIFDYCGAPVVRHDLLASDAADSAASLAAARDIGRRVSERGGTRRSGNIAGKRDT